MNNGFYPATFFSCQISVDINPYPDKLFYLNFHPLQVVSRYRDPQLKGTGPG